MSGKLIAVRHAGNLSVPCRSMWYQIYNSLGHPTTACMPRLFTCMYAVVALGIEKRWTNPAPLSNVAQAIHRDTAAAFDVTAACNCDSWMETGNALPQWLRG